MPPVVPARLAQFLYAWRGAIAPARRLAAGGTLILAAMVAAHAARVGTFAWRIGAASVVAAVLAVWAVRGVWETWLFSDLRRGVHRALRNVDPFLAASASRAVDLVNDPNTKSDPITFALAHLHLERILVSIGFDRVTQAALQRASAWRRAGVAAVMLAVIVLALAPLRFLEGLDVAFARHGRAPLPIAWVDSVAGEVQVPRYLKLHDQVFLDLRPTAHPRGSVITVRARPLRSGRTLILTDGSNEAPFTDDGQGGIAARWTLQDSVTLEVASRFGDVLIAQSDVLDIESIPDAAPKIEVEGAPKTVKLSEVDEIDLRYRATDDHGLTEIDLVLRAGEHEERRVLARHQGQEVDEKGSVVVPASEPLLRTSYVPVELTIEARDNDPITGPKWGRSAAIIVVPPAIGEAEAARFDALATLRSLAVDQLAEREVFESSNDPPARSAHAKQESDRQAEFARRLEEVTAASYGGRRVSGKLTAFLQGQSERLRAAVREEANDTGSQEALAKRHDATRLVAESTVFAIDGALRNLAAADAASVAKRLADVAEAAAKGAELARNGENDRGLARLRAAIVALRASRAALAHLEGLGEDLGEVVDIGVRRIEHALEPGDIPHAELAAEHLAARLRRPFPSFSGGAGRSGATGGMPGPPSDDGSPSSSSSASDQFDAQQSEIDKIAREHAEQMDELRGELEKAAQSPNDDAMRDAMREHAERVRKAVKRLPADASNAEGSESAAAAMRSSAEMMADSMDQLAVPGAIAGAKSALNAADQALRLAEEEKKLFGGLPAQAPRVSAAREVVERELKWLQEQAEQRQQQIADKAREALERAAKKEDELGRRTQQAAEQGREGQAPLPEQSADKLDQASRAMKDASHAFRGRATERGTDRQREAQRLLETAQAAQDAQGDRDGQTETSDSDRPHHGDDDTVKGPIGTERVGVPGAAQFKGPEAFRKRVMTGLGGTSDPRLKDAVRRYAEGLLR